MADNHIVYAHDKFFRRAMSNQRVAREFLIAHLPEDIQQVIDLKNIVFQPRSHIDDVGSEATVDILYKTTIHHKEAYIYLLLEHQSKPDELMPFRMLKYTCNIIDQHLKKTKTNYIPLVYPMVIYHAKKPYPFKTDIREMVDAPKELIDQYFLKPFHLIDLSTIEDEELKQHAWAAAMEFALKHIFARDILPYLSDFSAVLKSIDQTGGREYIFVMLQYVLEKAEFKDKKAFIEIIENKISPEVGAKIMTGAELFREEGREQGMQQGMQQGMLQAQLDVVKRLLAEEVELSFIAKITGLSLDIIKAQQET